MPAPIPYKRSFSFTNAQADSPAEPLAGHRVDIELDAIAQASAKLTDRVNAGLDVDINQEHLEIVSDNIDKVVFVADNMPAVRGVAAVGPDLPAYAAIIAGAEERTTEAADRAEQAASRAEVIAFVTYPTLAALQASSDAIPIGSIVTARREGFSYRVLPAGAAAGGLNGYHIATAGGLLMQAQPGADGHDIRAFGAVCDGVADDTVPFRRMLETGETCLNIKGFVRITQNLTRARSTTLRGDGLQASAIRFANNATLTFQGGDGGEHYNLRYFSFADISFRAVGSHTGAHLVRVEYVGGAGGSGKTVSLHNCEFIAENAGSGYNLGLALHNCRNMEMEDVRFHGRRTYPVYGVGVLITGAETTGAPVEIFLSRVKCYFLDKAFDVAGWVEGLNLDECIAIACHYGLRARGAGVARPLITVNGCHFNTDMSGIDIEGFVGLTLTGNAIYGSLADGTNVSSYRGVRVVGEDVALNSRITDNDFQTFHAWTDSVAIEILGNTAEENVIIGGNTVGLFSKGVRLGAGTNRVIVRDDNDFIAATIKVEDLGTDNRVAIGTYNVGGSRKRFGDGLDFRFGSSVVNLNGNGDGSVTIDPPIGGVPIMAVVCNGDKFIEGSRVFNAGAISASQLEVNVRPNPGIVAVRVNWIVLCAP